MFEILVFVYIPSTNSIKYGVTEGYSFESIDEAVMEKMTELEGEDSVGCCSAYLTDFISFEDAKADFNAKVMETKKKFEGGILNV